LFDECSCDGSPEARDRAWAERLSDDESSGEGEGITRQQLREVLASTWRGSA
jgi:hypothetical protein